MADKSKMEKLSAPKNTDKLEAKIKANNHTTLQKEIQIERERANKEESREEREDLRMKIRV